MVQDLKGNIRVFCRIRPLISNESLALDFDGANDGDIGIMNGGTAKKTFKFERVYPQRMTKVSLGTMEPVLAFCCLSQLFLQCECC